MPRGPSDQIPQASGPRNERRSVRDCNSPRSIGAPSPCMMQTNPLNETPLGESLLLASSNGNFVLQEVRSKRVQEGLTSPIRRETSHRVPGSANFFLQRQHGLGRVPWTAPASPTLRTAWIPSDPRVSISTASVL